MLRILKSYDLPFHTVFKPAGQKHSGTNQNRFDKKYTLNSNIINVIVFALANETTCEIKILITHTIL